MKNFTRLFIVLISLLFSTILPAQYRNYTLIYSGDAKGGIVMFGNTLMNIVDSSVVNITKMNDNSANGVSIYGNDQSNMQYTDADGNNGSGGSTRNSSTADLVLPPGTNTITMARLYWGGRVKTSDFDLSQTANQKINLRKGTAAFYTDFTAAQIDKNVFIQNGEEYIRYQAFTDITNFVQSNGGGTYSAGNTPLSTGAIVNGGNYGGWCIVVVYENATLNYNSLRLYDGFQQVFDSGNLLTTSITLTGLNVPQGTLAVNDAKMGIVTWEGDANLAGDFLKINGNLFSNGINQPNNPWNGTISDYGMHVTTKNPNYTNQMGIDIDQFYTGTGYGIQPNATTALLEFGTEADQYFPGIVSFEVKSADPSLPVSLFYFNSTLLSNNVAKITWGTSIEINCAYFTLERSFDGKSFSAITTVKGNGTTSLQHDYFVMNDLSGVASLIIYYRLNQVDLDGKEHYSKIIACRIKEAYRPVMVSPNPFTNQFNVKFEWNKNEIVVLNILDVNGKKRLSKNISLTRGHNYIRVDETQLLEKGTYLLQITSGGKRVTEKIFRQ